ncbi:MAG: hypothetical protein ABIJ48_04730 [Actinomycetota bacterium]
MASTASTVATRPRNTIREGGVFSITSSVMGTTRPAKVAPTS